MTLVLSVPEIALMMTSFAETPDTEQEATEDIEAWVEHMRAGGFATGRDVPGYAPVVES